MPLNKYWALPTFVPFFSSIVHSSLCKLFNKKNNVNVGGDSDTFRNVVAKFHSVPPGTVVGGAGSDDILGTQSIIFILSDCSHSEGVFRKL